MRDVRYLLLVERRGVEAPDVVSQSRTQHVGWHGRLKLAFANEEHDGAEQLSLQFQKLSKAFDVAVILTKRILKPILVTVDALTPGAVLLAAENPTLHVLGLDYEDTEYGNQNMIQLCCAILRRKNDVINAPIEVFIESQPQAERGQLFSEPAFEHIEHGAPKCFCRSPI